MNDRSIFIVLVCVLLSGAWWYHHRQEVRKKAAAERLAAMYEEENDDPMTEQESMTEQPSAPAPAPLPSVPVAPLPPMQGDEGKIMTIFANGLKDLGTCLDLKTAVTADQVEPTFDNWMNSVRSDLGDPVIQTEDWSTIDLTTVGGERRRIRIEMDYSAEERVIRRLKYFKLGETADTPPEPIFLTKEQSEDPSETFIASLEADGQINLKEKAQRVYFQNGEEIIVTDRNGRVADIEMSRQGRSFKCQKMDTEAASCKCY